MNPNRILAAIVLLTAVAGGAHAQGNAGAAPDPEEVGAGTRAWVDLQTGGTAASPVERPMPGDIATRVYQRHADSFAKPIPDSLGRESFVGEGGGGN